MSIDGILPTLDGAMNAPVQSTVQAKVTVITAHEPACITKQYRLDVDGQLRKQTTAHVTAGRMEIREVSSLQEFAGLLQRLSPDARGSRNRP